MSHDPNSVAGNYSQVYGYGAPPPQGYGRPKPGGLPTWAKVLIIILVIVMGGCGAIVGMSYYWIRKSGLLPNVPRAQVVTGTAIRWRTLAQWKPGGFFSGAPGMGGPALFAGNFDRDAQPELLLTRPPVMTATTINSGTAAGLASDFSIYELDGQARKVAIPTAPYMMSATAWDYDGDGVDEIVTWNGRVEAYDTGGRFITMLNGGYNYSRGDYTVDIDGDGHDELLLTDAQNSGRTIATGIKGKAVWSSSVPASGGCWGNIDSDKAAEYVEPYGSGTGGPQGTDMQGQVTQLSGWPGTPALNNGGYGVEQLCCADVTGDGIDEVIDPAAGFLDPKTQHYVALKRPIKAGSVQTTLPSDMQPRAVAGDFDGDGRRELAVTDSGGSTSAANLTAIGTALVIYRADGSVQYYEEFGRTVDDITVVHDGKHDRLALALNDRLLLSP